MKKGDLVVVVLLDASGEVVTAWQDDLGRPLFKVKMDDPNATTSGYYIARADELRQGIVRPRGCGQGENADE